MLKNDRWISEQASLGMLEPFQEKLIRHLEPESKKSPVLSFGCSSYGYDLRLSSKEFLIFRHVPGTCRKIRNSLAERRKSYPYDEQPKLKTGDFSDSGSRCLMSFS